MSTPKRLCIALLLMVVGCYPPIEHEVDGGIDADATVEADMAPVDMALADAAPMPDAELDAQPEPDAAPQPDMFMTLEEPPCSDAPVVDDCFFGETSNDLVNAADVRQVDPPTTLTGLAEMDALIQQQLVYGFGCEGVTDAENAEQAVAAIDEDRVQVIEVTKLAFAQRFTWLKFYQGDTEVGFIFAQNELNLVARVSDGDIVACRVPE